MPHFAKRILSGANAPEFHFNRIFTVSGPRYHVSVKSILNTHHYFMMMEKNGNWSFSDESCVPQWILQLENELQKAITEHLQTLPQKK